MRGQKILPALGKFERRELLTLAGEWHGGVIDRTAHVSYEVVLGNGLDADDISVTGLHGEDGHDLLCGYGEDGPAALPEFAQVLYRCAQKAVVEHLYALEQAALDESRARRAERMLTGGVL